MASFDFTLFDNPEGGNTKIVSHLNSVFGKDIVNLSEAMHLVDELRVTQKSLEQQFKFATSSAPDKIFKAVQVAEDALQKSMSLDIELITINKEVQEFQANIKSIVHTLQPHIQTVEYFEKVQIYQNHIASIKDSCEQMKLHFKSGNDIELMLCYETLKQRVEIMAESHCTHLKKYCNKMLSYWYEVIRKYLERNVDIALKELKWPFNSEAALKQAESVPKLVQRLENFLDYLLKLETSLPVKDEPIPISIEKETDKRIPSIISDFSVDLLPLEILLKPFEVRFLYHFSGRRSTNSRSNPEWYFTQVLRWIAIHNDFLDMHIQPILNSNGYHNTEAKVEFLRGLLRLVALKLSSDFVDIKSDEDLFCQIVQASLNFEREIRLNFGYPSSQPSLLNVLTQPSVFSTWVSLERKFALELMDEFISNENAWEEEEGIDVSLCGNQLTLLLQGITDRYKPLPQPGHRLQFLDLQLDLLDDFRVRILQLTKSELPDPIHSHYISILNTVHHIVSTLSDWSDLPFFIEMQYFKGKLASLSNENKEFGTSEEYFSATLVKGEKKEFVFDESFVSALSIDDSSIKQDALSSLNLCFRLEPPSGMILMEVSGSVFQDISDLYTRIEGEMIDLITQHTFTELRARSLAYRRDKWFVAYSGGYFASSSPMEVSPSFCSILECLVKNLSLLKTKLRPPIFLKYWEDLATSLDKFIYEEVILQSNFSEYGSAQLRYDMEKSLFPIFGDYHSKPQHYFPLITDCLILLTLPKPTAILMRDALKHNSSEEKEGLDMFLSASMVLEEHQIFVLKPHEAEIILNIRTNLSTI